MAARANRPSCAAAVPSSRAAASSTYEVREEPFGLIEKTMTVVDERGPGDAGNVQFSNFRCCQDCESGEAVVIMSRLGGKTDADWRQADRYRHRIALN
jgi:hypothetical protein